MIVVVVVAAAVVVLPVVVYSTSSAVFVAFVGAVAATTRPKHCHRRCLHLGRTLHRLRSLVRVLLRPLRSLARPASPGDKRENNERAGNRQEPARSNTARTA